MSCRAEARRRAATLGPSPSCSSANRSIALSKRLPVLESRAPARRPGPGMPVMVEFVSDCSGVVLYPLAFSFRNMLLRSESEPKLGAYDDEDMVYTPMIQE
jgi:hypothetical protein